MPGTIQAGAVSDEPLAFYDFLPTACELARVDPPGGIDGISFLPTLLGGKQTSHEFLFWKYGNQEAIRRGSWKGVRPGPGQPLQLYNLAEDIGETHDVAGDHREVVAELDKRMEAAVRKE